MLIKKLYTQENLSKRLDLYSSGNLYTAFSLPPDLFLTCECRFWMAKNKTMIIIVDIESKETLNGYNVNRRLNEPEEKNLKEFIKNYFDCLPEHKIIRVYDYE